MFLNPAPHGFAPDMAAIEEHVALRVERRGVNDRHGVRGVLNGKPLEFLLDAGQGIQVSLEILDHGEAVRRPHNAAIGICIGIRLRRIVPAFKIFQVKGRGRHIGKAHQGVGAQGSGLLMQVLDEIIHLEFFERGKNRLAVVVAGDGEDAQVGMRLLPMAKEVRQAVEDKLRLLDRQAQRAPKECRDKGRRRKSRRRRAYELPLPPPRGKGRGHRVSRRYRQYVR